MKRERAVDLAAHLLRNLDAYQGEWPLSLLTKVYVFGSFARGALGPHDLDIDVEFIGDERWHRHVVTSLMDGRYPHSSMRQLLTAGKRGIQFQFEFRERADFEMTLLWRHGDDLGAALDRLHAIQADPAAGRAERESMLPEFEGLEEWIARPDREILCAAISDGAIRIERLRLSDALVESDSAAEQAQGHVVRGDTGTDHLAARRLYLSEATVKTHVGCILAKLGLRDRVHVVIFAYDHGLVRPA